MSAREREPLLGVTLGRGSELKGMSRDELFAQFISPGDGDVLEEGLGVVSSELDLLWVACENEQCVSDRSIGDAVYRLQGRVEVLRELYRRSREAHAPKPVQPVAKEAPAKKNGRAT